MSEEPKQPVEPPPSREAPEEAPREAAGSGESAPEEAHDGGKEAFRIRTLHATNDESGGH